MGLVALAVLSGPIQAEALKLNPKVQIAEKKRVVP